MKPKFIDGGVKNGHDPKVLEKIWADWEKFASYAFNKSHAACYSWVAYQTAYLKAHYPAEFMAALLTRRRNDIKEITKLMDECKSMGLQVYGPDVNESYFNFGVNKKGEIRYGMAAIKGMSEAASNAIIKEREKNGPYTDIYNLVERVPATAINKKALECLAMTGALDRFGIMREQYVEPVGNDTFIGYLTRYAQHYQQAKAEAANSLFGDFDAVDIVKPKPPKAMEWSAIERLNKERELVGIYLSAHPLDEYGAILSCMCNTKCSEIGDQNLYEALSHRDTLTVGGIVTNVRPMTTKKGDPMGRITIEDFEGQGEFVLFKENWVKYQSMLSVGNSLFIKMKSQERPYQPGVYSINVVSIDFLSKIEESAENSIIIHIDMDKMKRTNDNLDVNTDESLDMDESLDDNESLDANDSLEDIKVQDDTSILTDLATLLKDNPGKLKLSMVVRDSTRSKQPLYLRSRLPGVKLNRQIFDFIASHESLHVTMPV
jgi:DNA polymerase-3 subunit alpha